MGTTMNIRKKICIFMGEITLDFQKEYNMELASIAKERNLDVVLFASFGAYTGPTGRNMFFEMGEKNVMNLPVLSEYDGIIVCSDTFDITGMDSELWYKLKKEVSCPVISLRSGISDYPVITVDNKAASKEITNHFIKKHGFTKLAYMSGPLNQKDGKSRFEGFKEAMDEAGFTIQPYTLFEGNYWNNLGAAAVDRFLDCPKSEKPQAIICANDYMALSVVDELEKRGIRIPEDICVAGFDDVPGCTEIASPLTSIKTIPTEYLYKTLELLDRAWAGEELEHFHYVDYHIIYRESCGCGTTVKQDMSQDSRNRLIQYDKIIREGSRISSDYQTSFTMNNAFNVASHHYPLLDCGTGFLCLCDEDDQEYSSIENEQVYSNNMILKLIMHKNKNIAPNYSNLKFRRSKILPKEIFDGDDYPNFKIVFQVHFRTKAYGYLVIVPKANEWPSLFAVTYLDTLAFAIESSVMEEQVNQLYEIKKQYVIDPLTNIYNRRGYEQQMQTLLNNRNIGDSIYVTIVSIDMDNLKHINDVYGHAEGDIAIQSVAEAINVSIGIEDFCARIGGDEFIAVITTKSSSKHVEIVDRINLAVENKSNEINKPYKLHASIGVCGPTLLNELDLLTANKIADERMYENKRKYKQNMANK